MNFDIKKIIKSNNVYFDRFRQGIFYYKVLIEISDDLLDDGLTNYAWYVFPVPLDDIGDATLPHTEKAIMFMRYIRQAITDGTFVLSQD